MPVTAGVQECFAFRLGEKVRLALPADWVQEVVQMAPTEICPLPGVAASLLGVVNRNGYLCWVLDLADFLGLAGISGTAQRSFKTVVLRMGHRRLAWVVTALEGIFTPDHPHLRPLPPRLQPQYRELLQGLVYRQGEAIALLAPMAVLARLADGQGLGYD